MNIDIWKLRRIVKGAGLIVQQETNGDDLSLAAPIVAAALKGANPLEVQDVLFRIADEGEKNNTRKKDRRG